MAIVSLTVLPTEVQIMIVGHLAVTSERPMDDLHSLWVTCSSMRRINGDPTVDQRQALVSCHTTPVSSVKVIYLVNQIALLLSYMGLSLACIVQRFLHGSAIPGRGAFPRWCQRVVPSPLAIVEPICPRTTLWF